MALLDVSDVLLDPDFADSLICERITKTVGDDGLAVESKKTIRFTGVVTNDDGDRLRRLAEGEYVDGNIAVHCRLRLEESDVVVFMGRRHTVQNVLDYSHFGRGFVAAKCQIIPLAG
jgi:galactose-6-phosphate isomerase